MGAGRPTDYKPEYNDQARKLCLLGATDKELADFFEVVEDTINEWKKVYPDFSVSVKSGKISADAEVAHGLFRRAIGYQYEETTYEKIEVELDGEKDPEEIKMEAYKKKVVVKELAPDPGAGMNWLSNRQRKKWRQKIETGFTDGEGNDVQPVQIIRLPDNGRDKPI